jgi:hypothetical protein
MKRGPRPSQALVVVALSLAGVGVGHVGEYMLLARDDSARHRLLAHTGHQYLPSALSTVAFVALVALAVVFVVGVRRGLDWTVGRRQAMSWSATLPVAQMLAFAALEVTERLVAHAPLNDLVVVLAVGLPLQAFVGFLAGRLTVELERAGERLGQRLRAASLHARRSRSALRPPAASGLAPVRWSGAPIPARGPPFLVVV